MTKAENLRPDVRLWDLIARELRRQRDRHKETQASMAALLALDQSSYARYESGEVRLTDKSARGIDRLWNLEGLFENLVRHAKAGRALDWWETFKQHEKQARVIRVYEPSLIPGLLQTKEYARGLFVAGRRTDVSAALEERVQRQAVLAGPRPATYFAIMDPAALYRRVGTREIMAEQLQHLLAVSELPNVYVRVVSEDITAYGGIGVPLTLLETPNGAVALGRAGPNGLVLTDPDDVQGLAVEFERIGMVSMTVEASRNLISKTLDGL